MEAPKTIFFFGKPGSGKGTQAKKLAEKTGWPMFGSGDQFRSIANEDTYAARKLKEEMEQGLLAPPWFVEYLYLRILSTATSEQPIVLDGFNRKPEEATLIFDTAEFLKRPFIVLNIAVSDEEVQRRLQGRKENSGRADDHAVQVRLEEYEKYTKPTLEIFKSGGRCIDINGEQSPNAVASDVSAALGLN